MNVVNHRMFVITIHDVKIAVVHMLVVFKEFLMSALVRKNNENIKKLLLLVFCLKLECGYDYPSAGMFRSALSNAFNKTKKAKLKKKGDW